MSLTKPLGNLPLHELLHILLTVIDIFFPSYGILIQGFVLDV